MVTVGRICIDSGSVDEVVEDVIIHDRRHLSEEGVMMTVIAINRHTGQLESQPEIVTRGFVAPEDGAEIVARAREIVVRTLETSTEGGLRRDQGQDQHRSEALHRQGDLPPASDFAGDSGGVGSRDPPGSSALLEFKRPRFGRSCN